MNEKLDYFIARTDERLERMESDLQELLLHRKYMTGRAIGAAKTTSIFWSAIITGVGLAAQYFFR